jgi:glycosyltransferase involved in cell wall biosynthesis
MNDRPAARDQQGLRIAHIAPVATTIPPSRSGSVETMTSLLTEGLVARGHDVTLFATGDSMTQARLHAIYPHGYSHDPHMWPWEFYELLNLAAAIERSADFDLVHYEAEYYPMALAFVRLARAPVLQTLHYSPAPSEVGLWSKYPEAAFVAISSEQARLMQGLNLVGTVLHAVDTGRLAFRSDPDDYLLFLGRFTEGKGVLQAIDIAKIAGTRLILAAAENEYYRNIVAPHVDGAQIVFAGEADYPRKVDLLGGARALLYPVQTPEPFGLVLAEAMACGTPVAALDCGAVREIVDNGVTGIVFENEERMAAGLSRVLGLDRRRVRDRAVERFGVDRMVAQYEAVYRRLMETTRGRG